MHLFVKTIADFNNEFRRAFITHIEDEIDLTYPQWRVMKAVRLNDGEISAKEIADSLCFDRVTISDIVNRLVKKGFLVKTQDEDDKRRYNLNLSEISHTMCQNVMCIEDKFENELFDGISSDDIEDYIKTTERLLEKLREMNRRT